MSQHLKGLLITLLGVFILSPDALLVRLADSNTWTILFWRGLLFALGITLVIFFTYGNTALRQFIKIGKMGIVLGIFFGLSTTFFVIGVQYTSIANALVIISISPVFAAIFSWTFLNEKTNLRTWITIAIIIAATAFIMLDSFKTNGFWGDMSALVTAILLAVNFTITRQAKNINMVPAMAIAGLTTAAIAAIAITVSSISPLLLDDKALPYLLGMGLVTTLAFSLITLGPRYMPAAEVGMIMPLETIFGAYLAWFFIGEAPSNAVFIGGTIIFVTLMIHAWFTLKETKSESP